MNNEIEVDNTTVFIERKVKINRRNEIYLRGLYLSSNPAYINVLVRNNKNNELISFQHLEVKFSKSKVKFVFILSILIIIFIVIYHYYNEIKEKCVNCYIIGFNFSQLFGKKEESVKYSNLSDNYY